MIARKAIAAAMVLIWSGCAASAQAESKKEDRVIGILLAAGDISTCGDNKEWKKYANRTGAIVRTEVKKAKDKGIPVHAIALGDLAYGKGKHEEFDCFAKRWNGFDDVLLPVPGNHEYLSGGVGYFKYFEENPFVNQNGKNKGYFSLNVPRADGPWLLIGLNDNFEIKNKHEKDMDDQLAWLERKLHATKEAKQQNCVLAFWHRPLLSSGRHGHKDYTHTKPNAELENSRPMRAAFELLYKYGATAVLAGHDHNYEQFGPHDADGKPAKDGIRSFVVGTGGSLLTEDFYKKWAPSSEGGPFGKGKNTGKNVGGNGKTQGLLKIELFSTFYQWEFLPIDGKTKLPLKTTSASCNKRKKPAG